MSSAETPTATQATDSSANEPLYSATMSQAVPRFFGKYAHFKG